MLCRECPYQHLCYQQIFHCALIANAGKPVDYETFLKYQEAQQKSYFNAFEKGILIPNINGRKEDYNETN